MGLVTLQSVKTSANVIVGAVDLIDFRLAKAKSLGANYIYNNSIPTTELMKISIVTWEK